MKKEELLEIGLTEEQANKVFAINGADVERANTRTTQAKADLADAQAQLAQRDKDLEELKKSSGDTAAVQKQLDELQKKYDTETEQYKAQLAEREYSDAMTAAITGKGLKFSSKSAEKAFRNELAAKKLAVKDGSLEGFDEFLKAQQEADPGAFAPDKPPAAIVGVIGSGGAPAQQLSAGAKAAIKFGERFAPAQDNKNKE